jgi:hypothetical protein
MKSLNKIIQTRNNKIFDSIINKDLKHYLYPLIYKGVSQPELFHVWFETISDLRKLYPLTNHISVVE